MYGYRIFARKNIARALKKPFLESLKANEIATLRKKELLDALSVISTSGYTSTNSYKGNP